MSSFRRIFQDRWVLFSTVVFATVACDQLSKWVARDLLKNRVYVFWGDLFRLQHAENPGAFLSMGSELPDGVRVAVFAMAVVAVVGYALFSLLRHDDLNKYFLIAVSLVAGGGVGNLIDRLIKGTVTDFFNLGIGSLRTGIFNIADMAIVTGVTILVFVPSPQAKKNPPRVSGGPG